MVDKQDFLVSMAPTKKLITVTRYDKNLNTLQKKIHPKDLAQ